MIDQKGGQESRAIDAVTQPSCTRRGAILGIAALALLSARQARSDDPDRRVVIYASADAARLAPVLAEMAREAELEPRLETGDDDALLDRLIHEGAATSADIVLLTGVARIHRLASAGLLQPLALPEIESAVPPALRDPGAQWFGLATYVRALVHSSERVKAGTLRTYEDPTGPVWAHRLCLPPGGRPPIRTLLASLLLHGGPELAVSWARALKANAAGADESLAATDDGLIAAIAEGRCDAGLISSRALGRLAESGDRLVAEKITVVWPNQANRGAFVDVIAAGVTKASERRPPVLRALGWLAGDTGQRLLATALYAYPVRGGVPLSDPLTRWGPFKADATPLALVAERLYEAGGIADGVGWP